MEKLYFVAATRGAGIIGSFSAGAIRVRLASGSLPPHYLCLPVGATGDLAQQWRPLSVMFGPPRPGDAIPPPEPTEYAAAPPPPPPLPPTIEERVAFLESRLSGPAANSDYFNAVGWLLLTFGQFSAVFGCIGAILYPFVVLVQFGNNPALAPTPPTLVILFGAAFLAFLSSAALFVVFTRVKRIPPV